MIRATASAAALRPTARHATARRRLLLTLLLLTVLALVGTVAVGQRAAADEWWNDDDDIRVNADGVAFESGRQSDEVAYAVRPVGSGDERSFWRDLSRDEQYSGWAAFREAREAYPNGYCVVWVEVEDASSWRESGNGTACSAAEPPAAPAPTPTPTAEQDDEADPVPTVTPTRAQPERDVPTPTPTPTPSPTPTPTSSPTPSRTASSTPTPSPSYTSPAAALVQNLQQQPTARAQQVAAEEDEIISPLGWVAVLGGGALLTAGGALVLWRRLT